MQASQSPAHLIIASRTPSKMQESINELKAEYPTVSYHALTLDLSTQKTVRAAADELLSWEDIPAVDILVNSAGIMNIPERTINEDGIEIHFATNHIGHFLFTCLVMPKLLKAAEKNPKGRTRIINVTSGSPTVARPRWSDRNFDKKNKDLPEAEQPNYQVQKMWGEIDPEEKSYLSLEAYNQSKVANVLFSVGATQRLYAKYGILSLAVHPGTIQTELLRAYQTEKLEALKRMEAAGRLTWKTQGGGASTSLVAALDPKLGLPENKDGKENLGAFLADCQISDKATPEAVSSEQAERMWSLSEELVNQKFAW